MRRYVLIALSALMLLAACGADRPHVVTHPTAILQVGHLQPVRFGSVASPSIGEVFDASTGTWSRTPTSFAYQWQRCNSSGASCSNISAATGSSYTVTSGDQGSTLRVVVTATFSDSSTATSPSPPTGLISSPTTAFSDPLTASSIATGPNQWTVVDNTIGNTNSFQCDRADKSAESSSGLTETITSGSFTCPGPTGGNGGITSCPGGTCSASYASGEIHARDQAFEFGTMIVTLKVAGDGSPDNAWPALWMLGQYCQHPAYLVAGDDPPPCSWHSTGSEELDVAEYLTGVRTAFTCTQWPNGAGSPTSSTSPTITDASQNFHTYELDWNASSIVVKVDGTTACTQTNHLGSLLFPIVDTAMSGTSAPSQPVTTITSVSITPAGPDITSQANWPSISGSTTHGNALTADHGTWTGSPTGFTYQWMTCDSSGNDCSFITTGSSCSSTAFTCASSYTTTAGEVGDQIQVLVDATNASGVTQYGSQAFGPLT